MDPEGVDRLCDLAGIEPGYQDAWGNRREPNLATKHALLVAMGIGTEAEADVNAVITTLEDAAWRRPLPSVHVVPWRRTRGPVLPIYFPAHNSALDMEWRLELEGGEARQGTLRFSELPVGADRKVDNVQIEQRLFELPVAPPFGYHRFRLFVDAEAGVEAELLLIVAPKTCYLPARLQGHPGVWGYAVQLYSLRSERNWGIGDFTDLRDFVEFAAKMGAGAVGLNPLHALFPGNPAHASPYSPSSRNFLNILYLDVGAIPEYELCDAAQKIVHEPEFSAELDRLRSTPMVDYVAVGTVKRRVLELLYSDFRERHLGEDAGFPKTDRGAGFRRFQLSRNDDLESLSLFEALSEHFGHNIWKQWPDSFQRPDTDDVAVFAQTHRDRVEFFQYLQWEADRQLRDVAELNRRLGMPCGLYHDMSLGVDGNGAEAWARQDLIVKGATLGAPPDDWNLKGQNWGIPPLNPAVLREQAYQPFISLLRANMRHGGALRLDHVMGLMRLFWIPEGMEASEGAYVHYPLDDLFAILALESRRQRCVVIGEDLGTLPERFHELMHERKILSYRPLYFQKDSHGKFLAPESYPELAAVVVGTHDLATFPGYWVGKDLEIRVELGLYPSRETQEAALAERERDREHLISVLTTLGFLPKGFASGDAGPAYQLIEAVYRFLARTPSRLLMVHLEDILGQVNQVNLPGTTEEHPNWRRKLPQSIEMLAKDPGVLGLATALRKERTNAEPIEIAPTVTGK